MTQSDYEDPLVKIINTICFDYSRTMYQELGMMQVSIHLISTALNIHWSKMDGNQGFQRISNFVHRLRNHHIHFLKSVGEFEGVASGIIQKMRTTQIIKVGERIHCRRELKRLNANELIETIQLLQKILYDAVTIISVLQTRAYIIQKYYEKIQNDNGNETDRNFFIAVEKLNVNVRNIREQHDEVREALRIFNTYLEYAILAYA